MSVVIPISPLNIDQAQNILETLALLTTAQHKKSKLVFYDTTIVLESDSSLWRTANSWGSSLVSGTLYYTGISADTGSRELSDLPPLIEKVHAVMIDPRNIPLDLRGCRARQELTENAQMGLTALQTNEYQAKEDKAPFFKTAQTTLDKIKGLYKDRSDALLQATFADARSKREREEEARAAQAAQRELEITRLKERIVSLEQLVEKDQKNGANWLTLLERTKQTAEEEIAAKYGQRIADLEQLIATQHRAHDTWMQMLAAKEQDCARTLAEKDRLLGGMVLSNTVDLDKVPTAGILAMVRVLFDILAGRQAQQS
jgi:hypothetical protein